MVGRKIDDQILITGREDSHVKCSRLLDGNGNA